jgi:hypothetical protein
MIRAAVSPFPFSLSPFPYAFTSLPLSRRERSYVKTVGVAPAQSSSEGMGGRAADTVGSQSPEA